MTEFVVEAFTNKDGQVIEPGEDIFYVATSNKTTMFRKAKFKGVKYGNVTRSEYLRDENGAQVKEERKNPYTHQVYMALVRKTTTDREVVSVVVDNVNRGKKFGLDENGKYAYIGEDIMGTATLPLMRIYKLDSPMSLLDNTYF